MTHYDKMYKTDRVIYMVGSEIFLLKKPNNKKLSEYGFVKSGTDHIFITKIADEQFSLSVTVYGDGTVGTKLIDQNSDEEYILHLIVGSIGAFVGKIREEYIALLEDIAEKCFEKEKFKTSMAKQLIRHVYDKYNVSPEYLWESTPDNAVWRRPDNKKWFGALLTVSAKKLGFPIEEKIEILNLSAEPSVIDELVDDLRYFRGYHMNKKHWFSVCMDGSVDYDTICELIEKSYQLAEKKHK